MQHKSLVDATIYLLEHRDRSITIAKISDDCKLTKSWISTLSCKKPVPHPSAIKIEKLYEYLSGKKLDY